MIHHTKWMTCISSAFKKRAPQDKDLKFGDLSLLQWVDNNQWKVKYWLFNDVINVQTPESAYACLFWWWYKNTSIIHHSIWFLRPHPVRRAKNVCACVALTRVHYWNHIIIRECTRQETELHHLLIHISHIKQTEHNRSSWTHAANLNNKQTLRNNQCTHAHARTHTSRNTKCQKCVSEQKRALCMCWKDKWRYYWLVGGRCAAPLVTVVWPHL